jgi:hypothetical protein
MKLFNVASQWLQINTMQRMVTDTLDSIFSYPSTCDVLCNVRVERSL